MDRRTFLTTSAAAAAAAVIPTASAATPRRRLLLVFASGGWDPLYVFDRKRDAPPLVPAAERFFERHGAISCVVNGLHVRSIGHKDCSKRVLTGTPSETNPDIGAITAHALGRDLPIPYLVLGDTAYTGNLAASAGRVGQRGQLRTLLQPGAFDPTDAETELIRQHVRARAEREVATRGATASNRARVKDFLDSLERSDELTSLREGLSGGRRGGGAFRAQLMMALRAAKQDMSWAVAVDTRMRWDTHQQNERQADHFEALFDALGDVAHTLAQHKMLDDTVVAVLSEMGRTPHLTLRGGKNHWPVTSALVFGGGVAGGRTLGATDDGLEAMPVDLKTGVAVRDGSRILTHNFAAGLLTLVGVDPTPYFGTQEVFHGFVA